MNNERLKGLISSIVDSARDLALEIFLPSKEQDEQKPDPSKEVQHSSSSNTDE